MNFWFVKNPKGILNTQKFSKFDKRSLCHQLQTGGKFLTFLKIKFVRKVDKYKYKQFKESIKKAAELFKKIDKNKTIRLVSHLDCDGICACSILIKALNNENRKYSVSIVQQLNKEVIDELSNEKNECIIFSDLGSGQLMNINKFFKGKNVFILDHHELEKGDVNSNITHINPHLFKIDGGSEISGSGVVYLFAKYLNEKNSSLAHLAVIGAIGDIQEKNGFLNLNAEILADAVKNKKINVKTGLRAFGIQTRPIHKVLEYTSDPYIPGVSGSESGAIQFLHQIGINPKREKGWKTISQLNDEETKKLITGIIMNRLNEDTPEDVLGNIYILNDEKEGSPLKDAKEFSTLLNSCGRLKNASLGIGTCLGDRKIKQKAIENLARYKREIVKSLRWYGENKNNGHILKGKGYMIINAKDNIKSTIIGTLASILSKSKELEDGTFIMSMAYTEDNTIKASLRIAAKENGIDLREIVKRITSDIHGAEAGGHINAAGAVFPINKENEFIRLAKQELSQIIIEEKV